MVSSTSEGHCGVGEMAYDSRHTSAQAWTAPHVWGTAPPKSPTQGAISSFLGQEYTPSSPPSSRSSRPRSLAMLMNPFSSFGTSNNTNNNPATPVSAPPPPPPPPGLTQNDEQLQKAYPTLTQVLHNETPPPYTLSSFMAFLSSMHSLEILEFLLDASRYRGTYEQAFVLSGQPPQPSHEGNERIKTMWVRLIEAYVRPGGSREVNLPGEIRDGLLHAPVEYTPPPPELLDASVNHIYNLMRDSVLSSFIASCDATTNASNQSSNRSDASSGRSGYWNKSSATRLNRTNSNSSGTSSRSSSAELQSLGTSVSSTSQPISIPYPVASQHHRNPFPPSSAARSVGGFLSQSVSTTLEQSHLDSWLEASGSDEMSDIEESGSVGRNSSSGRASPMTPPLTPPPQGEGSPIREGGIWSRKVKEKFRRRKN